MKLSAVIDELIEERNLDRDVVHQVIIDGYSAAYEKKFPELELRVEYDKRQDIIVVKVAKEVVSSVKDEDVQISLRKAKGIQADATIGKILWLPLEDPIGRIEVLRARQVIMSQIAKIEARVVYEQFKDKQGEIVYGVVHKCETSGTTVKVAETLAFLPRSLDIPEAKSVPGYSIRALIKEVLPEPRNETQIILDRASGDFVRKLFEIEVPEIFEGLVEIKALSRAPGYKTKLAVVSRDANIDPVGTCVGVGGGRIKPILRELGTEKVDVIAWSERLEQYVTSALKPAQVNRVQLNMEDSLADVWLDDDQRPLAIGKGGKNIMLASMLTGVEIRLAGGDNDRRLRGKAEVKEQEGDAQSLLQQEDVHEL